MPVVKKNYQQITNDILTQITGGDVSEDITFSKGKIMYVLSNTPVAKVTEVKGTTDGSPREFTYDKDLRLSGNSVEWVNGGEHPDDGTHFIVKYRFKKPSGITDLNPGSVVRTLVEAMGREIEYLYGQLQAVYNSGFLETAEGDALDMTVALLGITRKPPQPSSGFVTFGRGSEPEKVEVTGEVHLYDGSPEYELEKDNIKEISKIEGTVSGIAHVFKAGDYVLTGRKISWLPGGKRPDARTVFKVDYTAFQKIAVPKKTRVATSSVKSEQVRIFTTVEEVALANTNEGKWEAEAPVICVTPGTVGNVLAGAVTIMPQPVIGLEYVINKSDINNGTEAESDEELRERTKHALEFAAKATTPSLDAALKGVDGVNSILIDDMPGGVPGIVRVVVDGGDQNEIQRVIDDTRAAGIKVEFSRPKMVYIDASLTLILEKDTAPTLASKEVEVRIRNYISSLKIAEDVLYSRFVDCALRTEGVWDVRDLKIFAHREGTEPALSEKQNINIEIEERASPRNVNILFGTREKHE